MSKLTTYLSCLRCYNLAARLKSEEAEKNPAYRQTLENGQFSARMNVLECKLKEAYFLKNNRMWDDSDLIPMCMNCEFQRPAVALWLKEYITEKPIEPEKPGNYRQNAKPGEK